MFTLKHKDCWRDFTLHFSINTMTARRKTGGVDLRYFEHSSTYSRFDPIKDYLLAGLSASQHDLTFTSRDLSMFTAQLQQFQEDALGLPAQRSPVATLQNHPPRIPSKLFKLDGDTLLTTESPLYKILFAAYQFRIMNTWKRWDFTTPTKRDKNVEMVAYIRDHLVEKGVIRNPKIAFAEDVEDKIKQELSAIAEKLGGMCVGFCVPLCVSSIADYAKCSYQLILFACNYCCSIAQRERSTTMATPRT